MASSFADLPFLANFKCLPLNFLHDLTPGSSYGMLESTIFASSQGSLTLFRLPSLTRARVPATHEPLRRASAPPQLMQTLCESPYPSYVMSHCIAMSSHSHVHSSAALEIFPSGSHRLLTCICYAMCLKHCTFCSMGIPCHISLMLPCRIWEGWWGSPTLRGPMLCTLLQYCNWKSCKILETL